MLQRVLADGKQGIPAARWDSAGVSMSSSLRAVSNRRTFIPFWRPRQRLAWICSFWLPGGPVEAGARQ